MNIIKEEIVLEFEDFEVKYTLYPKDYACNLPNITSDILKIKCKVIHSQYRGLKIGSSIVVDFSIEPALNNADLRPLAFGGFYLTARKLSCIITETFFSS